MEIIEVKTLIDITNTKVIRLSQGSQIQLDQQRNFITLMQCIEIKSIIEYTNPPQIDFIDIKNLGFGSNYKGRNKIWTFKFKTDRSGVYLDSDNNPIGLLIEDIHEVPIIKNLNETINIEVSIFDCKDQKTKNTMVRQIQEID